MLVLRRSKSLLEHFNIPQIFPLPSFEVFSFEKRKFADRIPLEDFLILTNDRPSSSIVLGLLVLDMDTTGSRGGERCRAHCIGLVQPLPREAENPTAHTRATCIFSRNKFKISSVPTMVLTLAAAGAGQRLVFCLLLLQRGTSRTNLSLSPFL